MQRPLPNPPVPPVRLAPFFTLALMILTPSAAAAGDDVVVREAVRQVLSEDAPVNLRLARTRLQEQLSVCLRRGCGAPTKAEVYVALGIVAAQEGRGDDARQAFRAAQRGDPNAKLFGNGITPAIRAAWDEAKGSDDEEQPAGAAVVVDLLRDALKADREGRLDECIDKAKQALRIRESPHTRLHLASCEERSGKLLDALRSAEASLSIALQRKKFRVVRIARHRVVELIDRIPHLVFVSPPRVSDLVVTIDARPVTPQALTDKLAVDPGKHRIVAASLRNGCESQFDATYEVKEKDFVQVTIALPRCQSTFNTAG
jgi:hypothetical protein